MYEWMMPMPTASLRRWWKLVGGDGDHPDDAMEWKLELARRIVARWHGDDGVRRGEEHFTRVVRQHEAPPDVQTVRHTDEHVYLPGVLSTVFGQSVSHWRRVIDQGGVRIDGAAAGGYEFDRSTLEGKTIQAGKRRFFRLTTA